MPLIESAKKALRGSKRKHVYNLRRKDSMKDSIKGVKKLISAKKLVDIEELLSAAYKAIDKAAKRGVIKKNTASRKKSRLVKMIRKVR